MTAPGLAAVSHLGLSSPDLPAARTFWTEAMGFELVSDEPYLFLVHRECNVGVIVVDHDGEVSGPFDERRTGIDHLALAVADAATLELWEKHLAALDVEHSPISETDAGLHLNLRAPDGFPVELFVMSGHLAGELGLA